MVTFLLVNQTRTNSSIAILVSFNGQKYRRSTGESVPVKMWNNAKKRAKVTAHYTYGDDINDVLGKWESAALRTISYFKEYYNPPTKKDFFAQLDKEYYKDDVTKGVKLTLFADYFAIYIDRYSKVRSLITIKKYVTALNKIKEYETKKRKKLNFEDISIDFYNDFQHWFYEQGYSDNYFGSIVKIIKQTYREAKQVDKLHSLEDISHKDFITTKRDSDSIYLTEQELLSIHRLNITPELVHEHFSTLSTRRVQQKTGSLKLVRDRFLIGAYTGLRVSDFGRLGEMNIGKYIRIKTTKTGSDAVIPIHPVIKEILSNGFDPQIIVSDQKINVHIKEIAQLAGITEKVLVNKYIAGKVEQVCLPKYKLVCTHTARRSFATNAYKAGVPTIAIMKITGHSKESTFLKYIKVSAEENADILNLHPFFNNKEADAEPIAEPNTSNEIDSLTGA